MPEEATLRPTSDQTSDSEVEDLDCCENCGAVLTAGDFSELCEDCEADESLPDLDYTREEMEGAKSDFRESFWKREADLLDDMSDLIHLAQQRALVRLYPEVEPMVTRMDTRKDGTRGHWSWMDVWVGDEYFRRWHFFHITLQPREFLALFLAGQIVADPKEGYPRYIGVERLRGHEANYALPGEVARAVRKLTA